MYLWRYIRIQRLSKKNLKFVHGESPVYRNRFRCKSCKTTIYPLDDFFHLEKGYTDDYAQVVGHLIAVTRSFKDAAKAMHYTGVTTCSLTLLQKIGNKLGTMLVKDQDERLSEPPPPEVNPQVIKPSTAMAVLMDGGRCRVWGDDKKLTISQWREVKTGGFCLFDTSKTDKDGKPELLSKEYIARVYEEPERFGQRLYQEALYRGYDQASKKVFLGDGAKVNWETHKMYFSEAIGILDWYHASSHLSSAGKLVYGENTPEYYAWFEKAVKILYEGDFFWLDEVLAECKKKCKRKEDKDKVASERNYFHENRERTYYKKFREQGLPIGSGPIESGIKMSVNFRMKGTEKHWRKKRADNILALRVSEINCGQQDLCQLLKKVA